MDKLLDRFSPDANLVVQIGLIAFLLALLLVLPGCAGASAPPTVTPPPVAGAATSTAEPGPVQSSASAAAQEADHALAMAETGIDAAQLALGLGEAAHLVPAERAAKLRGTLEEARDLATSARSFIAHGDIESALRVLGEARELADQVHRLGGD